MSSLLFGGQYWFNSLPHYRFSARMISRNVWIEKLTLGRMDALEQLDDLPVYTIPNQHPPKMDVLPKTFLHSSLRHSSTSPKQQRRPLPSLLYESFFYEPHALNKLLLRVSENLFLHHWVPRVGFFCLYNSSLPFFETVTFREKNFPKLNNCQGRCIKSAGKSVLLWSIFPTDLICIVGVQ